MADSVVVYIRPGDPQCDALLRWLDQRKVAYEARNIEQDVEAATAIFQRAGRVVVPTILLGDKMIVGYDPVQLARFLPAGGDDPEQPGVSFGAAVRTVSAEVARAAGLPAAFGVEVGPVKEGSPAALAGIETGDVISAIGSYTITGGADQFRTAVAARKPGDVMSLTVWHGGGGREVSVEFAAAETAATPPGEAAAEG